MDEWRDDLGPDSVEIMELEAYLEGRAAGCRAGMFSRLQKHTGLVLRLGPDDKWHLLDSADESHLQNGDGMNTNEAVECILGASHYAEWLTPDGADKLLNEEIAARKRGYYCGGNGQ